MKRGISLLLCMLLMLGACGAGEEEERGGLVFALEWMKSDSVRGQENAVISPASAYLALTMAAMGAEGGDEGRAGAPVRRGRGEMARPRGGADEGSDEG